jgi:uncharacterized repeat protein (TIGR02543 family)
VDPVDVRVSFQRDGEGFDIARQALAVMPGIAAAYGYGSAVAEATALDALVAAHIAKYGEDVDRIHEEMEVADGSVYKVFGRLLSDPTLFTFLVNGAVPNGGAPAGGGGQGQQSTAHSIDNALIKAGDLVEFYCLPDGAGGLAELAWFELDGKRTEAANATQGEPLVLTLKGYPVTADGLSLPDGQAAQTHPLSGAAVVLMKRDIDAGTATFEAAPLAVSGSDGKAALRFDEPGVYLISAVGGSGGAPLLSPWCAVTVYEKDDPSDGSGDAGTKTVYFSVEKFTLGRGYVQAPVAVTVSPGENVANIVDKVIGAGRYQSGGSFEQDFYLTSVRDDDRKPNELYIPEYILRRLNAAGLSVTGRGQSNWLGESDYVNTSGWMYAVNDRLAPDGMSDYTYENLRDGDVIRLQFALCSGADLGYGVDAYRDIPSRDALTRVCAGINSAANRDVLLAAGSQIKGAYEVALAVMSDLEGSTQATIPGALANLNRALDNEYVPPDDGGGKPGDEFGDDYEPPGDDDDPSDVGEYPGVSAEPDGDKAPDKVKTTDKGGQTTAPGASFIVRFLAAGGKITKGKSSYTVRNGSKYGALPTAVRKGYKFSGWFTGSRGGTRIMPSTPVNLKANQTLYAHWEANRYRIKFNVNGGKALKKSLRTKTVTFGGKYGKLPTPVRKGYAFRGWYTKKTGGKNITAKSRVKITGATTLYARWKRK